MDTKQILKAIRKASTNEEGFSTLTDIVKNYADLTGADINENKRFSNTTVYKRVSSKLKEFADAEDSLTRGKVGRQTGYRLESALTTGDHTATNGTPDVSPEPDVRPEPDTPEEDTPEEAPDEPAEDEGTPVDEFEMPEGYDLPDPDEEDEAAKEERRIARKKADAMADKMRGRYEETRTGMIDRAQEEIQELPPQIDSDQAAELAKIAEMRATLHADGVMIQRFLLGVVARRMKQAMDHGTNPMKQLSEATDVHVNTIRECKRLAVAYDDNIKKFDRTLISINERKGRATRWTDIQTLIRSDHDPSVLGADALAERIISKTERLSEQMDKASGSEEAEGAIENLSDSAERFREEGLDKMYEQETEDGQPRNDAYLEFVRRMDCCATGSPPPNEPHHLCVGGGSMKGTDYICMPVSREAHAVIEDEGIQAFVDKYGVDPVREALQTLHMFVSETDRRVDLPIYTRPDEVKRQQPGEVTVS